MAIRVLGTQDNPITRRLAQLPWCVKLPAVAAGFLMSLFFKSSSGTAAVAGRYLGVGFALLVVAGSLVLDAEMEGHRQSM
jgi:hypothetical protein